MPVRDVDAGEARELSSAGRSSRAARRPHGAIAPDGQVAALLDEAGGRARPVLVFAARCGPPQ